MGRKGVALIFEKIDYDYEDDNEHEHEHKHESLWVGVAVKLLWTGRLINVRGRPVLKGVLAL